MKDCTNFPKKTFPPKRSQEKPKPTRVAIIKEDEEELKQLAEEEREEELTVGKVVIQDFEREIFCDARISQENKKCIKEEINYNPHFHPLRHFHKRHHH